MTGMICPRTPERDQAIVELIRGGATLSDVAAEYNLSRERCRQIYKELTGAGIRSIRADIYTPRPPRAGTIEAILMFEHGLSVTEIARRQGVSYQTAACRVKGKHPHVRTKIVPAPEVVESLRLWEAGHTVKEIARIQDAPTMRIYHRLHRNGIRTIGRYKERGQQP
jgi:DNA-binding Lrp family transcriptional regulator